ncbi:MAG: hypothetical protein IKV94_02595 [Clostridia bacterium]|nr:hypothetical protein [Clostridia bacterium]MBR6517095.1 hypothetical protein [Bacilli bacterium]
MSRPGVRAVKRQLFLRCGRVDMYSMEKYAKEKLVLHHEPPFRKTKHTIYEESYLLSEENHKELHILELDDHEEYVRRMNIIKENKKILERTRK